MTGADTLVWFVLQYLETSIVHGDVRKDLAKRAENLRTKNDVENWMASVKAKLGRMGYREMISEFHEYVKIDCGFDKIPIDEGKRFRDIFDDITSVNF